jgi:hypothetical protein
VLGLACFRITRLIVQDTIADRPRNWVIQRSTWLGELVSCPWCASFYVALGAAALFLLWPATAVLLCLPWALAALAALPATFGGHG